MSTTPITPPFEPVELWRLILAMAWIALAGVGGGLLVASLIGQVGSPGSIGFWPLGAVMGYIARKITGSASRAVGVASILAIVLAILVAETAWLHWETENGEASWQAALEALPLLIRQAPLSLLIAAVSGAFGGQSAWQFAASRVRWIAVHDRP